MKHTLIVASAIAAILYGNATMATGGVPGTAVPYTFTPSTTAKAAEVNANFSELINQTGANAADIATLQGAAPTIINISQYFEPVGTFYRTFAVTKPSSSTTPWTTDTQTVTRTSSTMTEEGVRKNASNVTIQEYTNAYTFDPDGTRRFTQRIQKNYSGGVLNTTVTTTMDHPERWPAPIGSAVVGQTWGGATTLSTTTEDNINGGTTDSVGAVVQTATLLSTLASYTTSGGTTYNDCIVINLDRSSVDGTIGGYFSENRILCKNEGIVATIRLREEGNTNHWFYERQ